MAEAFGFDETYPVSGQTYSRKVDSQVVAALAGVAESAHRFGSDLRLLAHEREVEEPFEAEQVGSSAMAYKRNPMRAERMCSIARFAMALPAAASQTAATQWLERTLDDSAVRRLVLPQAFLAVDALLTLYLNVVPGLVVHPAVIARHVADELPFMATENLLMAAVQAGGDRQDLHERIRTHSLAAAARLKEGDGDNDLIDRLARRPGLPAARLRRRARPAPVRRPGARAGRRLHRAGRSSRSARRYPDTCGAAARGRRLSGSRTRDRPAENRPGSVGETVSAHPDDPRPRSVVDQTRAAWRALRSRFSSSRRRRSLGFS